MATLPLVLDPAALRRKVSNTTFERGLALYRGQKVLECDASDNGSEGWQFEGKVQGTQRLPYDVRVDLLTGPDGSVVRFKGYCSCPVGADCKHAVALTIKAAYREGQVLTAGASAAKSSAAPARSPITPAPTPQEKVAERVQQWLRQWEPPAEGAAAHNSLQDTPLYLLQARRNNRDGTQSLELSWRLSRRLIKGGWGKTRTPSYDSVVRLDIDAARNPALQRDLDCVRLIQGLEAGVYRSSASMPAALRGDAGAMLLQLCATTGRLFWAGPRGEPVGEPLAWGAPREPQWHWEPHGGDATQRVSGETSWALRAQLSSGENQDASSGDVFTGPPAFYVDLQTHTCGLVPPGQGLDERRLHLLLAAPPLPASSFRAKDQRLLQQLAPIGLPPDVKAPEPWPVTAPIAHLSLAALPPQERAQHGLAVAVLRFDYGGLLGWWGQSSLPTVAMQHGSGKKARQVLLQRDLAAEAQALAQLQALGLHGGDLGWYYHASNTTWLNWVAQDWQPLRDAGFVLEVDEELAQLVQVVDAVDVELEQQPDSGDAPAWFDLSLGIEIDGQRQNILPWLPEWLAQVQQGDDGPELPEWLWRALPDGRWLRLPSAPLVPWLRVLLELVGDARLSGDEVRLSRFEALRLAGLGEGVQWAGAEPLRAMLHQLAKGGNLPDVPVPAGLKAALRPYQHQGLQWLQFLRVHQLGGVLADDMGLGKTLQTLAHLLVEKEAGRMDRPCLIVVPVSLLGNWRREAERFAPGLRTRVWHGSGRHGSGFAEDCDLLIAPYSLLQRDRERWLAQAWHVVVLDEAQHIKNASTHAAQVVAQLDARQRLALTGTPLENHLGELWSLFHFLMPGFLGSQKRFAELFRTPIEKLGDSDTLAHLRRRVTPFMLRRTKDLVAKELPPLIENLTTVTLEGAQADLYETIRLATEKSVCEALAEKGLARSQIQLLDALLKLRQVCCDPRLVKSTAAAKVKHSAKLDLLMELLPDMLAEGRRVLLFSQFTSMLTLIEERLQKAGIRWTKLTGQTHKREEVIARFTSGEVPLFLISLKAGGTGLNLPQADTVIHYDPWWNPAVEAQATGRAHRIGQTRQVMAYKLVAEGTIEERILALQERKAALAQGVLSGAAQRRQPLFTEDDVAELLKPLGHTMGVGRSARAPSQ